MEGSYDLATHTILDNTYNISKNSLKFMKHSNNGNKRFDFYNIFKLNLESIVKDFVGSHFGD